MILLKEIKQRNGLVSQCTFLVEGHEKELADKVLSQSVGMTAIEQVITHTCGYLLALDNKSLILWYRCCELCKQILNDWMQVVQRQKFAPVAIFAFARISNGLIQRVLVGTQTEDVVRGDSLTRNIKQHISKFSIILHLYIRHITILPSHISMMDGINSLQFIEEIFIEILIRLVKRQFRLEYLFGEMLFSRSSCNHVWTFESTTPTATCRLQEVFIALTQGICNLIFLLFAVV